MTDSSWRRRDDGSLRTAVRELSSDLRLAFTYFPCPSLAVFSCQGYQISHFDMSRTTETLIPLRPLTRRLLAWSVGANRMWCRIRLIISDLPHNTTRDNFHLGSSCY